MRIISGKFKGRRLLLPKDKLTRPIKDLLKESMFNSLMHSKKFNVGVRDKKILDIFSGTGSFGLECLSRGASYVTFVENYKPALDILKKNIYNLKVENQCQIFERDISRENSKFLTRHKFDIIFMDPPYKLENIENLANFISLKKILINDGILLIHRHKKSEDNLKEFIELESRVYGISKISFLKLR